MVSETLKIRIKLFRDNKSFEIEYFYRKKFHEERPMVLDVLFDGEKILPGQKIPMNSEVDLILGNGKR